MAYPVIKIDYEKGIWQLGRICSYWRSVLLSSPSLWSTIHIQQTISTVPVTEKILSLSGNSPLRIILDLEDDEDDGDDDDGERSELFCTVLAASHRWYTIAFNISYSQHPLVNQLKGRVPMLTEVICDHRGTPLYWLEGAPSLQKLEICDISASELLVLPWSQLREFDCRRITVDQEYQILRQCVNLETYTLDPRDLTGPVPSDLCMAKLRTLTVFTYPGSHTTFMDILTVPSLDEVTIHSVYSLTEHFFLTFRNLLSRSHCFPTKLEINDSSEDTVAVLPLTSLFSSQNLTTLHVSNILKHNLHLISTLTLHPETEDSVILLPRLENLYLRPYWVDSDDLTLVIDMIDMVRSRWHLHERVKVVSRLAFFSFLPNRIERPLQLRGTLIPLLALRDEGLKMNIDEFYL